MAPKSAPKAAPKPAAKPEAKAKGEPKKKPEKKEKTEEEERPRVSPPDTESFQARIREVQDQIDGLQKEQAALTKKISERSGGKDEFFAKKAELRSQLDEHSGKMNELQERKEEIMKAMGEKNQERRDMQQNLNKMKKSIGYSNESEIDDRIASIEFKLWTDTISLKEEKKCLAEIQELKRNRPKVTQVHQMESKVESFAKDSGLTMKEKAAAINEEMAKYRQMKAGVSEKLKALMDERKSQLGDLPEIVEQRDGIGSKIQGLIKQRTEIRDELKSAEREYYAYQAELRKVRQEKQMEERKKKQEEWSKLQRERKAEKLDEQPYVSEITLIEQTILFCKSLMPSKDAEEKQEKKETVFDNPDGTQVLMKKEDRDEEFYFTPTSKGKKGKSKAKGGKQSGSTKPIKHNAETFRLFDQLKLDAPITTDDIPPLLEKLEAQLKVYEDKVEVWKVTRDERKQRILQGDDVEEEDKKEEDKEEVKDEEEKPEDEEEKADEEQKEEQKEEEKEEKEEEKPEEEEDKAED